MLDPDGCGYRNALGGALRNLRLPLVVAAEIHGPEIQLSLTGQGPGPGFVPGALLGRTAHADRLRIIRPGDSPRVAVWMAPRGLVVRHLTALHIFRVNQTARIAIAMNPQKIGRWSSTAGESAMTWRAERSIMGPRT